MDKLNDWNLAPDAETLAFHLRQAQPYRSTVAFASFARPWLATSNHVIDLGCGAGQATAWLAGQFPQAEFLGLDMSEPLLTLARQNAPEVSFTQGDMYDLKPRQADGVISLATLSWMPEFQTPLDEICKKIAPKWMAFSSLFYDGYISTQIVVDEHKRPRKSYYNIYSIQRVTEFLMDRGYKLKNIERFHIDIELPRPENRDLMKSYTWNSVLFSGPLMLPLGFLVFERVDEQTV